MRNSQSMFLLPSPCMAQTCCSRFRKIRKEKEMFLPFSLHGVPSLDIIQAIQQTDLNFFSFSGKKICKQS